MRKLALAVTALAFTVASCGGGGEAKKEETTIKAPEKTAPAPVEEKADVPAVAELVIEGNDQMKFNLDKLEVSEGQTVKLTLKHVGTMAKAAMGHNWVLLAQGVDKADFAAAAVSAKDNDYMPEGREADVIARTATIGGGEEITIEFEAPAKGTYEFICSFPGHYGMMNGKFIVK